MTDNEPAHSQSDGTPARREFGRRPVLALFAVGGGAALLSRGHRPSGRRPARVAARHRRARRIPARGPAGRRLTRDPVVHQPGRPHEPHAATAARPARRHHRRPGDDRFTAQSIFEQTTFDNRPPGTVPPVRAGPTGPRPGVRASRIVLRVPAGTAPFPYDLPTLLDLPASRLR